MVIVYLLHPLQIGLPYPSPLHGQCVGFKVHLHQWPCTYLAVVQALRTLAVRGRSDRAKSLLPLHSRGGHFHPSEAPIWFNCFLPVVNWCQSVQPSTRATGQGHHPANSRLLAVIYLKGRLQPAVVASACRLHLFLADWELGGPAERPR